MGPKAPVMALKMNRLPLREAVLSRQVRGLGARTEGQECASTALLLKK